MTDCGKFHRIFSKSMYKNLKLPLAEMSFSKDFINEKGGDLYPLICKSDDLTESVENNRYFVKSGTVERMFCALFPYATYEISFNTQNGECGFSFYIPNAKATVKLLNETLVFSDNEKEESYKCNGINKNVTLIISCRPSCFDVYFKENDSVKYIYTFKSESFAESNSEKNFKNGYVTVLACGNVEITEVGSYIDCGISQADMRPIRYENGDVMVENGKIYLSISIRMQEDCFQGIVSWAPGTSEFCLTGAVFYDSGDGKWSPDVAASILYDRNRKEWLLWVCSFSHGHILGHSAFNGDPRFGVNVIDITLMEKGITEDITDFSAFEGDEDPDFYYDEECGKWRLAICRLDHSIVGYRYIFFESDKPLGDYIYIGKGVDGSEMGGSFVTFKGEKIFACGNAFDEISDYRIYSKSGMYKAEFDFCDGGFRGWGTIIPIDMGSRKRYFWITFDRHNGSDFNWSYGNVYCFELVD